MSGTAELWCDGDFAEPAELATEFGLITIVAKRGPGKQINEDACLVIDEGDYMLLAVADGMGGHAAGEHASRTALLTLADHFPGSASPTATTLEGVIAANQEVLDLRLGAGTTLALALLERADDGLSMRSFHVGDSNVYLVGQRGRLHHRSLSHSPTAYGQEAHVYTEAQALLHAERHVVLNAVGSPNMFVNVGPALPMAAKDTLLLCSDGLSDNLWEQEMLDTMRRGAQPRATRRLGRLAMARMAEHEAGRPGKPDDLSIILFRRN